MENLIAKTKSRSKRHAKTQSQDPELPHKIKGCEVFGSTT